jgi:hypothetical protein
MFGDNAPAWMCITSHAYKGSPTNESFNKAREKPAEILAAKALIKEAERIKREAERAALEEAKHIAKLERKAALEALSQRRKAERAEQEKAKIEAAREARRAIQNAKLKAMLLKKMEAEKKKLNRPKRKVDIERERSAANRIPPPGYMPLYEAALSLGRCQQCFVRPVRDGRIKSVHQGHFIFIEMESVKHYMATAARKLKGTRDAFKKRRKVEVKKIEKKRR